MKALTALRAALGAGLLALGLLVGATQVFAASTSLSVTVPNQVTLAGVPASGSTTLNSPSGTPSCGYQASPMNALTLGSSTSPITVSSNDALGEHVTIQATNANFVGTASASNTFADNLDSIKWTSTFADCANATGNLSTTVQTLLNRTTGAAFDFGIDQEFSVPGTQNADTYTNTITLLAVAN